MLFLGTALQAQTIIYSANFGTASNVTTNIFTGWTASLAGNPGVNTTNPSVTTRYSGASGSANLYSGTAAGIYTQNATYGTNLITTGYSSAFVRLGAYKVLGWAGTVSVEWSAGGTTWNLLTSNVNPPDFANWYDMGPYALPAGALNISNLRFRIIFNRTSTGTGQIFRIDDFRLLGEVSPSSGGGGGTGSVTNIAATNNTGQTWNITNPTTTPNLDLTLTKDAVGLSNVDNTSDLNKPVSTATQTALNLKQNNLSLTTTGSGAATLVGSTLNIPTTAVVATPWTISGNNINNSNTGNVGIGTSTPTAKLDIAGNVKINNQIFGDDPKTYLKLSNAEGSLLMYGTGAATSGFLAGGSSVIFTSNQERFRVNPGGEVGIGTSNPLAKLEIVGAGNTNSTSALTIKNSSGDNLFDLKNNYGQLNGVRTPLLNLGKVTADATAYQSSIWPSTALQINEASLSMMPQGIANVASNSTQVGFYGRYSNSGQGLVTNKSGFILGKAINGPVIGDQTSGQGSLVLGSTTTNYQTGNIGITDIETMTLTQGNVGIGTSTPTAKLDIAGNIKLADGTQGLNKVLTSDAAGLASWQTPTASSVNAWGLNGNAGTTSANFIGTTDDIPLVFKVNGNFAGKISSGSDMSIGSGAMNLTTNGGSNTALGFKVLGKNTTGAANSGMGAWTLHENTTGNFNLAMGHQALFYNTTASENVGIGHDALFYNQTGTRNVGIGSWANTFNVSGERNTAIGAAASVKPENGTPIFNATAIGANAKVSQSNSLVLGSIDGTNSWGTPTVGVNVGIGTDVPTERLDVRGNIFTSGKVLVGTNGFTSTQLGDHSLAVNGSAIFTKATVKLQANWPDYVFQKNYKLTPLADIEKFIKKYGHLPEVPNQTEVGANGIDLGANQTILLKKVEELTLYAIDADKKISEQQKQIDLLNEQNKLILKLAAELEALKKKLDNK